MKLACWPVGFMGTPSGTKTRTRTRTTGKVPNGVTSPQRRSADVGVALPHLPRSPQLQLSSWSVFRLITSIASHPRDMRTRRVSVSSTEENLDLEASLAALRVPQGHSFPAPVPEQEEPMPQPSISRSGTRNGTGSLGRSRSPTAAVRGLANRLRSSIGSLGSPHSPVQGSGETIWTSKRNFATDTQLLFKR